MKKIEQLFAFFGKHTWSKCYDFWQKLGENFGLFVYDVFEFLFAIRIYNLHLTLYICVNFPSSFLLT